MKRYLILPLVLFIQFVFGQKVDYTSIAHNTWVLIDEGTYPAQNAGLYPDDGILAYSGMTIDSKNNKLLLFGGGHNDYEGNEVWAWDIDLQKWAKMYAPDTPNCRDVDNFNFRGGYLSSRRPLSRHTYDSVEFLAHAGVMIAGGASTYSGPGETFWLCYPNSPFDTWTYELQSNKWNYKTTIENIGWGAAAYDPASKLLIALGAPKKNPSDPLDSYSGTTAFYAYNYDAGKWNRKTADAGGLSGHTVMTFDTKRSLAYVYGGDFPPSNELWAYNHKQDILAKIKPQGPTLPPVGGGNGMVYDSANDVIIIFGLDGLWIFDLNTNQWQRDPGNPKSKPESRAVIFGLFKYDPAHNVSFLVTRTSSFLMQVWAYRHKKNTTSIEPEDLIQLQNLRLENFPNPFDPVTQINYFLPLSGPVTLKIFDALGHEVETLVNDFQAAGKHGLKWEGKNAAGTDLPNGIYFFRLQLAAQFSISSKMLLLRPLR